MNFLLYFQDAVSGGFLLGEMPAVGWQVALQQKYSRLTCAFSQSRRSRLKLTEKHNTAGDLVLKNSAWCERECVTPEGLMEVSSEV